MNMALEGVAETLAYEFAHLHSNAVVRVLADCVDDFPKGGRHFVEQAARARLSRLPGPQVPLQRVSERSSLDVSLHDDDLADEVDLMVRLIIAANESDSTLARDDIDEILGVNSRPPGSQAIPPTSPGPCQLSGNGPRSSGCAHKPPRQVQEVAVPSVAATRPLSPSDQTPPWIAGD